jgi:hypothetical protein
MIPYADFDLAIARWKARKAGAPLPAEPDASGAVAAEIPSHNAVNSVEVEQPPESGYVVDESPKVASGLIEIDDFDPNRN